MTCREYCQTELTCSRKIVTPALSARIVNTEAYRVEPLAERLKKHLEAFKVGQASLKTYIQTRDYQMKAILDLWDPNKKPKTSA